jgi:hypothetical protein
MSEPWFDPVRFGILYGAIGESALGALGGILGAASGYLAPRGKGRSFILGSFTTLLVIGILYLAVRVFAIITDQPYGIRYAFILIGAILTVVMGILLPVVRRRCAAAESRRIGAAVLLHSLMISDKAAGRRSR